jgi:hypothetical protein
LERNWPRAFSIASLSFRLVPYFHSIHFARKMENEKKTLQDKKPEVTLILTRINSKIRKTTPIPCKWEKDASRQKNRGDPYSDQKSIQRYERQPPSPAATDAWCQRSLEK